MPPRKAPSSFSAVQASSSDDDDNQAQLAELLAKMRRTFNDKKRKKRTQIESAYSAELQRIEAEAVDSMRKRQKEMNERRASFAARLANAVKRRSDAENELMEELQAVEEKMADGLGDVMDMLEDSRRAVCGE